jgi:hypothetical protein
MIRLMGTGIYTLFKIRKRMTITNALSNTGVKTSSGALHGCCGSQHRPIIIFTPHSIALTGIHLRNPSIPKCTLPTWGGRQWHGAIPEDDDILEGVRSMRRVGDTLVAMIFMSDVTHLSNFVADNNV